MDLDGEPRARAALRGEVRALISDSAFLRTLAGLGIRGIEARSAPNKDTDTTLRYKMRVVSQGGVPLPTSLTDQTLREARDRALNLSFEQYRGTVVEFLDPSERARLGTADVWDEQRLFVVELIEAILK